MEAVSTSETSVNFVVVPLHSIFNFSSYNKHHAGYGGSKHLWNVGQLLPDYMVQHPRRKSSSY
jgi:hypothetical protein